MKNRYEHLANLIEEHKPSSIIEVGVHKAYRAVYMVREAMKYQNKVSYIGFDVFETLGEDFQELVLNGKGMATEMQARAAMHQLTSEYGPRFTCELIVGKTQDTLHETTYSADLVFIDGDHRAEAIAADYAALKNSKLVVFDDYYVVDPAGAIPDLKKYGANIVCDSLPNAVRLPHGDQCRHGGLSHLVLVAQ